jgi:hypothetical protein
LLRLSTKKEKYQTLAINAGYMPFCTSCGTEITAENRFCTSCGAPMDHPAGPLTPESSPRIQPVIVEKHGMPKKTLLIIGVIAVIVIIAVVYSAGLPILKTLSPLPPVPTPVPSTPVSHLTTSAQPTKTPVIPQTTITPLQTLEERYGGSYEQVYTLNKDFAFGQKEVFSHDLTHPPLSIKFNLTPDMLTRRKVINIGLSSEETINITYPSPNAWFEVKVLDAGSGAVIDSRGFHKDYNEMTKQEFMVRNKGNYTVELSGNEVFAEVRILIGTS